MKRLIWDIETSPNVGFFWRSGHEIDVGTHNIITERAIICVCWKWAGEKKVHSLAWNKGNDEKLIKEFIKVLNQADEAIAHNGDRFDLKWFRGRCLYYRVPMSPKVQTIDTLKESRKLFDLNSHRLNYLGEYLGLGGKEDTGGFDTWRKIILENDNKALKQMVKYCKRDVDLLEKVFDVLNPYISSRVHYGAYTNECPECGSDNVIISKTRITAGGSKQYQFKCKDCGKYHSVAASKIDNPKPLDK